MSEDHAGIANQAGTSPPPYRARPATPLTRVFRLAWKELREILRDRRTIVTLFAMPLLLYPLMSVAFQQFYVASRDESRTEPKYQVGVLTEWEGIALQARLNQGREALRRKAAAAPPAAGGAETGPEIMIARDTELPEPANQKERALLLNDLAARVRDNVFDLVVAIPDVDPAAIPIPGRPAPKDRWHTCQVYALDKSPRGKDALAYLETLLAAANESDLKNRLDAPGVTPRIMVLSVELVPLPSGAGSGVIPLSALVPLILILMTITGAVYPAIDLTAGERERGTLEILVAAPVPRFELLTAKYFSVLTVAVLTALVNMVCMTITLRMSGLGPVLIRGGLSIGLILQVLGLLLLFGAFFSAVLLCLTSFARSFKEAQSYLIPLMLASLMPGVLAMMPGLKLEGVLQVIPLVNVVLLARDLFGGGADALTGTVVVLTTLLYALAALSLAAKVFGSESVLYNEQSGWSDLFRRPDAPNAAASIPAMLWCMALMVPLQFALIALARWLGPLTAAATVFAGVLINLLLFGALPALFVYLGRVRLADGVGVALPRPAALLGAALLGASLWPVQLWILSWSHTIARLEERFGRVLEELSEARDSLGPVVLISVIVPAILEEIFFRGLLFTALKARCGAWLTIGASGALFGLAHVVVDGALGLERLIPTTVLGLILGAIRWHTGSLWPGMIQHVLHNALLAGVGLYYPSTSNLVPWEWIVSGAIGSAAGVALLAPWGGANVKPLVTVAPEGAD